MYFYNSCSFNVINFIYDKHKSKMGENQTEIAKFLCMVIGIPQEGFSINAVEATQQQGGGYYYKAHPTNTPILTHITLHFHPPHLHLYHILPNSSLFSLQFPPPLHSTQFILQSSPPPPSCFYFQNQQIFNSQMDFSSLCYYC